MKPRSDPALVVVLAGMAAALHVGKLPTALPALREAFGLTLVEAGFLLSLVQLAGMALGFIAGLAAEAAGRKRTMATGLAVLGLASVLAAAVSNASLLMVLRAVEGAGLLLAATPAPALIRQNVEERRVNAALGAWGAYMPLGTAAALLFGPYALDALGWRGWWVVLGCVALAASLMVTLALPRDGVAVRVRWTPLMASTLRAPGPWLLAAAFGAYSAQWLAVIGFLPTIYAQAGWSPQAAGAATAAAALVNGVGNFGAGRLLQAGVAAAHLLFTGFVVMAIGAACAFAPDDALPVVVRYAGVIAFSMVGGLVPGTLFATSVRLAPSRDTVSVTVGWMQNWSSFGQFAGPPAVAWVAAQAGHWHWSAAVTAACAAIGILLAARIGRLLATSPP